MKSARDSASDQLFTMFAFAAVPIFLVQRFFPLAWTLTVLATVVSFYFFLQWVKGRVRTHSKSDYAPTSRSLHEFVRLAGSLSIRRDMPLSGVEVGYHLRYFEHELILTNGQVIDGVAVVDESAITGESAPVIRDNSQNRNFVSEGSRVVTGSIEVRVSDLPKRGFASQVRQLLSSTSRSLSPFESKATTHTLLLTFSVFLVVASLLVVGPGADSLRGGESLALLTLLCATCLSALWMLPAFHRLLSVAFLDRLIHRHLIPKNISALEKAGSTEVVIFNEPASELKANTFVKELLPALNVKIDELAKVAQLAALCDDEPPERALILYIKNILDLKFKASVENK